jgi:hypothetical protein
VDRQKQDLATTAAGGAIAAAMLAGVRWENIPAAGEVARIVVAFGVWWSAYFMYRERK